MKEITILVLEIILLILKGFDVTDATKRTSEKHGVEFATLWEVIPKKWK
ncbi:hypothetical protein [Clostridium weizhouense]|uniref:Uncharacterized protein n=1 Tax=Clostridium weizhouense TaxID=2859781 RepID=A0ABS7ARQ1_9CLOT|nr:hypothetical protein [Clostridium weizhouense]MBW6411336.1 hypothetical protein [Clostridium weizhouense]